MSRVLLWDTGPCVAPIACILHRPGPRHGRGTISDVTGNLRSSGRNALRAGTLIGLAGVVILVAALVTALDWLSGFGITFIAVGLGIALTGAAFRRTAASLTPGPPPIRPPSSERQPRDGSTAPTSPDPENGSGWLGPLVGRTDMSRMLDYEIEQREKSRKPRQGVSNPDAGGTGQQQETP
jgi:hypothetical protein